MRRHLAAAAAALAALALTACSTSSQQTTSSPSSAQAANSAVVHASINVATLPVVDNVVVWEAVKQGYFAGHGLQVKYENVTGGGPATVAAVQSGSAQFGQFSSPVFMIASAHNVPIVSVAEMDTFPTGASPEGVFVKASSPIHTIAQLKGATIGVNSLTSLESVRLKTEVLPAANLSASDVHLVPIPFPQMQEALSTGEVQAVVPFDPFTTRLRQSSGFRQLTDMTDYLPSGGLSLGVIAAMSSYASGHPKVVEEFDASIAESIAYIRAHLDQAAALASQVLGLPTSITRAAIRNINFDPGGLQDMTTYLNMAKALKSANLVPQSYNVAAHVAH